MRLEEEREVVVEVEVAAARLENDAPSGWPDQPAAAS